MHEIAIFAIIIMTLIRVIGVGVSFDYYLKTRERKFLIFLLGWALLILGGIFPFLADLEVTVFLSDLYLVLNNSIITVGFFFVMVGIYLYFREISAKLIYLVVVIIMITSIFLFIFTGAYNAILFGLVTLYVLFILLFSGALIEKGKFKEYLGKGLRWYYISAIAGFSMLIMSVVAYALGNSYGLYESTNVPILFINYFIGITITLLVLNLMIHFEYSISSYHTDKLKDKYSHNLGNILQVIQNASALLVEKREISDSERDDLDKVIGSQLKEASKLITEIRKLET